MNKWFLLLIAIGLAVTGWYRREMIAGWFGKTLPPSLSSSSESEGASNPAAHTPPPTPNLALPALEQAKRTYPALTIPGSAFRQRFEADYAALKVSDPAFLARADWPIVLGARTATELGGGAMPVAATSTPAPASRLTGSDLDAKAASHGHKGGPTPTPTPPLLPQGLKGSSLDQKPSGKSH